MPNDQRNTGRNRQKASSGQGGRANSGGSAKPARQWRKMDLHLHTPGSNDYQQPEMSGLDIMRQAVLRGLDIIALTDHNTVAGYAAIQKEIEQLIWLEELRRIEPAEQRRLDEYRRLLNKLLVLPGFEFTATFGFHILGIFPPETPVSFLEHLLLELDVPPAVLRTGSQSIGATSDVLTAYRVINEAGGLAIAAHANSANGVVMRGLDFGGQTRIAYTQDPNLLALEVTDLEKRGRYTTRRFFDGSKPEYPRPMRCIQGSDAHRLVRENPNASSLGIGDRVTEILLEEVSFEALAKVLRGNDHALTRPYHGTAKAIDFVQSAREEGESLVQSFHASMVQRGGHLDNILRDICAMANTNGGTVYVGLSAEPQEKPEGVKDPARAIEAMQAAISKRFSPEPQVEIDSLPTQGVKVVRINVLAGPDLPYAIDSNQFYVRDEDETSLAVRDEIVNLVEKGTGHRAEATTSEAPPEPVTHQTRAETAVASHSSGSNPETPRTGVEIVETQQRDGTLYHTLRDMRNGNLINNVTRSSARRLWHYAITQAETNPYNAAALKWQGKLAVVHTRQKGDTALYDLAMRDGDQVRVFYGVSEDSLGDAWAELVEKQGRE